MVGHDIDHTFYRYDLYRNGFYGMVMAQELGPGARPVGADWSRSPVMSVNGMAATAQPLASNIAIDVLQAGGSAVDAAVAANAALGLMEPTGNGIGGDLFAIVWDPKAKQLYGYNGSGRAPMGRSLDELREAIATMKAQGRIPEDYVGIPSHGSLSVTVPGAVDGWFALHERWGRLPMSDVLAAPIEYARNGFPLSPVIAAGFEGNRKRFESVAAMIEEQANATKTYFPGNVAPKAGDIFEIRIWREHSPRLQPRAAVPFMRDRWRKQWLITSKRLALT